jgi:hypothetical protein
MSAATSFLSYVPDNARYLLIFELAEELGKDFAKQLKVKTDGCPTSLVSDH